jgi:hypothetical protein
VNKVRGVQRGAFDMIRSEAIIEALVPTIQPCMRWGTRVKIALVRHAVGRNEGDAGASLQAHVSAKHVRRKHRASLLAVNSVVRD